MKQLSDYILEKAHFLVKKHIKCKTVASLKKGDKIYIGFLSALGVYECEFISLSINPKTNTYTINFKYIDNPEDKDSDYYQAIKVLNKLDTPIKDIDTFKDSVVYVSTYYEEEQLNYGLYDFVVGVNEKETLEFIENNI